MYDMSHVLPENWAEKKRKDAIPKPVEHQIQDAMRAYGITAPDQIIIDDQLHRYKTTGKDKSGWYVFYSGEIVAGAFGDWREGSECTFRADVGRELSEEEKASYAQKMKASKIEREKLRKERAQTAAQRCEEIWSSLSPASKDHPYLSKKGIQPHVARCGGDGRLVVPLYTVDGELSSLQYISHDSKKLFESGGITKACFCLLGEIDQKVYIAEGYATAATIYEQTGVATIAAYSASNLVAVTEAVRDNYQTVSITIVADHDKGGVGENYASQSAAKYGASVIVPPEIGDANDFYQSGGDLAQLLEPSSDDNWLISADDFLHDFKPISWIVKGVLPKSSSIMLFGPSGVGKSFLLIDLMMHVSTGKTDWHGHKVSPGQVVYLAGEGHHGIKGRIKAWLQEYGDGVTNIDLHISKSSCDLNTVSGISKVIQELQAISKPPVMIVIDTLNRFLDGDENNAKDARQMMNSIDLIRQAYPLSSNILCHHTGVAGEAQGRARGSSAWKASMEVELCLSEREDCIELSQKKAKDGKPMKDFFFQIHDVELAGLVDEDGDQVTSAVIKRTDSPAEKPKPDTKREKFLKLFARAWWHSGCEIDQNSCYVSRSGMISFLTDSLGLSQSTAQKKVKPSYQDEIIGFLLEKGDIEQKMHGWGLLNIEENSALILSKSAS